MYIYFSVAETSSSSISTGGNWTDLTDNHNTIYYETKIDFHFCAHGIEFVNAFSAVIKGE